MVAVLDKYKKPLGVCTERRARILMEKKRACIYRYYPFTIIVMDADARVIKPTETFRIKIDPGSGYTGISVIREQDNAVVFYEKILHRGTSVVEKLKTRNGVRRNRRNRETRYRKPKWGNKQLAKGKKANYTSPRPEGWLPPSVKSIGDSVIIWVKKLKKLYNIVNCSYEAVRFDTQLMDNPDIESVEYQQGLLFGYEVREYLLDKYGHICQYCGGESGDKVLEWEYIHPKSKGGSDSIRNATLACHKCNQTKDDMLLDVWKAKIKSKARKTKLDEARLKGIENVANSKKTGVSNRYCAWSNALRPYEEKQLFKIFGDVECASGGRTKFNRIKLGLPKDHHYDALCVGTVPEDGYKDLTNGYVLIAKAVGRGNRLRGRPNKIGILDVKYTNNEKRRFGFQSGDIVRADPPSGKYAGHYVGRVTTRANGYFDVSTTDGQKVLVSYKYCTLLQRDQGYNFSYEVC